MLEGSVHTVLLLNTEMKLVLTTSRWGNLGPGYLEGKMLPVPGSTHCNHGQ